MRITSPVEVTDPNDENVLVDDEVTVSCEVLGDDVDASSVRIELLLADEELNVEVAGQPVSGTNNYSADFVIAPIPNGTVTFRCTAESSTDSDLVGTHEIDTLIDHGPRITVVTPEIDGAYALAQAVPFEFSVQAAPLTDDDDLAEVQGARLVVEGMEVEDLEEIEPGRFVTSIDFNDPVRFPEPPVGTVPVEIYATNSRMPAAVQAQLLYSFVIDAEGPTIEILDPVRGAVVGGEVTLRFSVTDPLSGVNADSVVVKLNTTDYRYTEGDRWTRINDVFSFRFDTTLLADSATQATVNIRASDLAQNESRDGATAVYQLDNVAPIVDLNPGWVRERRRNEDVCSRAFDPVGTTPNDGDVVLTVVPQLRVLVWERTNTASGVEDLFHAGVDPDSVTVFLQPDLSIPLLVDTNSDDVCDELAVDKGMMIPNPPPENLARQKLDPIEPEGRSWFLQPEDGHPDLSLLPEMGSCSYDDNDSEPDALCNPPTSDLTRVIEQFLGGDSAANTDSAIYGIGAFTDAVCTGRQWEIAPFIPADGWICMAARAEDMTGNIGISAALPLCFDGDTDPSTPACALGGTPPTCSDGCTPPPRFTPRIINID